MLHYDLGAVLGAALRVMHPWGGHEDRARGSAAARIHRVGRGAHCEVVPSSDGIEDGQAVLEWAGPPDLPELHALHDDGRVTVDGQIVAMSAWRRVGRDESVEEGGYSLRLLYPEV